MIHTIVAPIIVFAVIVLVHEFGHFIMAKLTGMKVEEFAIGFGPKICSVRYGETLYHSGFSRSADSTALWEWIIRNTQIKGRL